MKRYPVMGRASLSILWVSLDGRLVFQGRKVEGLPDPWLKYEDITLKFRRENQGRIKDLVVQVTTREASNATHVKNLPSNVCFSG